MAVARSRGGDALRARGRRHGHEPGRCPVVRRSPRRLRQQRLQGRPSPQRDPPRRPKFPEDGIRAHPRRHRPLRLRPEQPAPRVEVRPGRRMAGHRPHPGPLRPKVPVRRRRPRPPGVRVGFHHRRQLPAHLPPGRHRIHHAHHRPHPRTRHPRRRALDRDRDSLLRIPTAVPGHRRPPLPAGAPCRSQPHAGTR